MPPTLLSKCIIYYNNGNIRNVSKGDWTFPAGGVYGQALKTNGADMYYFAQQFGQKQKPKLEGTKELHHISIYPTSSYCNTLARSTITMVLFPSQNAF